MPKKNYSGPQNVAQQNHLTLRALLAASQVSFALGNGPRCHCLVLLLHANCFHCALVCYISDGNTASTQALLKSATEWEYYECNAKVYGRGVATLYHCAISPPLRASCKVSCSRPSYSSMSPSRWLLGPETARVCKGLVLPVRILDEQLVVVQSYLERIMTNEEQREVKPFKSQKPYAALLLSPQMV